MVRRHSQGRKAIKRCCMKSSGELDFACSGCVKPNERETTTRNFRFRLSKLGSNVRSPRSWSFTPTGIVPDLGKTKAGFLFCPPDPVHSLSTVQKQGTVPREKHKVNARGRDPGGDAINSSGGCPLFAPAKPLSRNRGKGDKGGLGSKGNYARCPRCGYRAFDGYECFYCGYRV